MNLEVVAIMLLAAAVAAALLVGIGPLIGLFGPIVRSATTRSRPTGS